MKDPISFPCPPEVGHVFVYRRTGGVWNLEADLTASDASVTTYASTHYNDQFGREVEIDNGRILVAAPQAGNTLQNVRGYGQVYLFEYIHGTWQETYRLRGADPIGASWANFGATVAIDGATVAVGAPWSSASGVPQSGSVQVFYLPMGEVVCDSTPNSTGQAARLEVTGWASIGLGDARLTALDLPVGRPGMFLASRQSAAPVNPGQSQGLLCLGGAIARFNRAGEYGIADSSGTLSFQVPTLDVPTNPSAPMLAGETWHFQCWYRDLNPTQTSNFTQAVGVTWE